jgi:hypothetical protein
MKGLPSDNYRVDPFIAHKTQTYQYTHLGGGNPDQVTVSLAAEAPSAYWFDPAQDPLNSNGLYQRPLHSSLKHLFYSSASYWSGDSTLNKQWYPSGAETYVLTVGQVAYGEGILPRSFTLTAAASTASIVDDGHGRLIGATGTVVGNIFYGLGIATIQQTSGSFSGSVLAHNGLYLTTGSALTVNFKATHTIYQHTAICTMDIGDFNFSSNPTMAATQSAVSGTVKVVDGFVSGTLSPYMTSVGLYTDRGELVAVAKFPRPIKRVIDSQQTVIIRFDI